MSVKELTDVEVYAIMQSDMKLWESATTEHKGNTVTKAVILPFGIGEFRVNFEGVDNGIKRRAAAEQWGAMVRERVKDRVDDESVTARAQQAAALRESEGQSEEVGQADSGHGNRDSAPNGHRDQSAVLPEAVTETVQAHGVHAEGDQGPSGTDFAARAEWLRGRIGDGERQLKGWRRELKALDAALSVLEGDDE